MRTTSRHLLHLGSAALARQGVQNRLTAGPTPNDQPHLLDDALWKAWPDPWKPRVSPPQGTKPDADAVRRCAGVGASHRHALAAQLSGVTAEQAAAADGQKFPGRESGFGGVASFTE